MNGNMNDYWDIDSVLSENFKVPCFFPFAVPFVEWEGQAIIANSRVELPFWMAEKLALNFQVEIELPQELDDKTRQDILASPASVNLQELLPYYYASATKMSNITQDLGFNKLLAMAFKERLAIIRQKVQSIKFGNSPEFLLMLEEFEKNSIFTPLIIVYKQSNQALHDFENWSSGQARTVQMSSILK